MKHKSIIPKNEYQSYKNDFDKEILNETNQPKETMTIIHKKNSKIGYDTVNKCVASVRTPENTSYETMIKICIDKLIKGDEVEKYKSALINMAQMMDRENI